MKKVILLILSIVLCFGLVACGGNGSKQDSEPAKAEKPLDLTGDWTQINRNSEDNYMEATITENAITINWVFEAEDSVSLYWAGSYIAPAKPGNEYSWTSENDTTQTSSALLASTSETKDFTYKDGVLSFEASAMGTTMTVEMEQQDR